MKIIKKQRKFGYVYLCRQNSLITLIEVNDQKKIVYFRENSDSLHLARIFEILQTKKTKKGTLEEYLLLKEQLDTFLTKLVKKVLM